MTLNNEDRQDLYDRISSWLEEDSLEELLLKLDLDPPDAVIYLYEAGVFDPEELNTLIGI